LFIDNCSLSILYCSLTNMSADFDLPIELLTIAEVAELLKVSVSGVRRLQQARQLTFVKVGGSVRFSKRDILLYLEKRRVESVE
jgi:excisionase family DNA binding protein